MTIQLMYVHETNEKEVLGEILTNKSLSVEDALDILEINMEEYTQQQGWDDYDPNALELEYA